MGEEKKGIRDVVWLWSKLLVAFGALTAAVSGYTRLLEKQEDMLIVMSTKLNALSEKVAFLEGRMVGMPSVRGSAMVEKSAPSPAGMERTREELKTAEPVHKGAAYQRMPMTLDALKPLRRKLEGK